MFALNFSPRPSPHPSLPLLGIRGALEEREKRRIIWVWHVTLFLIFLTVAVSLLMVFMDDSKDMKEVSEGEQRADRQDREAAGGGGGRSEDKLRAV